MGSDSGAAAERNHPARYPGTAAGSFRSAAATAGGRTAATTARSAAATGAIKFLCKIERSRSAIDGQASMALRLFPYHYPLAMYRFPSTVD